MDEIERCDNVATGGPSGEASGEAVPKTKDAVDAEIAEIKKDIQS